MDASAGRLQLALSHEQGLKLKWLAREHGLTVEDVARIAIDNLGAGNMGQWVIDYRRGWSREDLYDRPSLLKWTKPWLVDETLET
jgi:hypothetical protein